MIVAYQSFIHAMSPSLPSSLRREYPPLSLLQLQRMIDLGRVNPEEPIDLNSICNTKLYSVNAWSKDYGVNLTEEVGSYRF